MNSFNMLIIGIVAIFYTVYLLRDVLHRLNVLEKKLDDIEHGVKEVVEESETHIVTDEAVEVALSLEDEIATEPVIASTKISTPVTDDWGGGGGWAKPDTDRKLIVIPTILQKITAWLIGGNTVARIGIFILFLGVAFFLKYAVDRGWLPIEMRLAGATLGGLTLTAIGWRLRTHRLNYALILQGGGIGIVYLTVFAAVNIYGLLTPMSGLILMVALVVLSNALAILQNASSLAVFAAVGGFLAPVIISSDGSHVVLFSYYAILNAGILGISWFKAWRQLNLIGFIFTFVIGGVWGYQFYQADYFMTTEPFLLLFFVFYLAVPVLFAQRQSPNLKGYVDGTLVFGVPLATFALQSALVRDFEYGLALSALGAGLTYSILATTLWREKDEKMRMLTEAFISLAVVFGTLAIPLAVDGRWTGAAWALEGAALVWIGVRQNRILPRLFGLLVELGAGIAFFSELGVATSDTPILNSFYLSVLMVSMSGAFTSYYLYQYRKTLQTYESMASAITLVWAIYWWFWAGSIEIGRHIDHLYSSSAILVFVAISVVVIAILRRRLDWPYLNIPPIFLMPVMIIIAWKMSEGSRVDHPFAFGGWIAWPISFVSQYWLLRRFDKDSLVELLPLWHSATLWLAVFLFTWEAAWLVEKSTTGTTWSFVTWALVPAIVILIMPRLESWLAWPIHHFKNSYIGLGLVPIVLVLGYWVLYASIQIGNPQPLPYLPLLNPLELSQCLVLSVILWWTWVGWVKIPEKVRWYSWSILAFVAMNGIIARATHYLGNVAFEVKALWPSPIYQSTVSITWTLAALSVMVASSHLKQRAAWIVGAALLAAVVAKLFLIDLADIETVARIVSFIVVGLLILLIGYLSPLPPHIKEDEEP